MPLTWDLLSSRWKDSGSFSPSGLSLYSLKRILQSCCSINEKVNLKTTKSIYYMLIYDKLHKFTTRARETLGPKYTNLHQEDEA